MNNYSPPLRGAICFLKGGALEQLEKFHRRETERQLNLGSDVLDKMSDADFLRLIAETFEEGAPPNNYVAWRLRSVASLVAFVEEPAIKSSNTLRSNLRHLNVVKDERDIRRLEE